MKVDRLPTHILGRLEEVFGVDRDEEEPEVDSTQLTEAHARIERLSTYELIDAWLRYEGIIGYTSKILEMVDTLQALEVQNQES